jgi:hypothetical protein
LIAALAGEVAAAGALVGATTGGGVAWTGTMGATVAGEVLLEAAGADGRQAISSPRLPRPPTPMRWSTLRRE